MLAKELAFIQINFQKFLDRLLVLIGIKTEDVSISDPKSLDNLLDRIQEFLQNQTFVGVKNHQGDVEILPVDIQETITDKTIVNLNAEVGVGEPPTVEDNCFIIVEGPFNSDVEGKAFTKEDLNRQIDFFEKLLERLLQEDNG